jgi:2-(1,2-epoxy-1,2-dihydrophenyl)acetyl-CoA isomerase
MNDLTLERDASVATITLARPERRNALDKAMIRELRETMEAINDDDEIRVVIVRGDGPAFSVGGALDMFVEAGDGSYDLMHELGPDVNGAARLLHETDKVTIAQVHGAVAGGAIGFACACDLVIAADDTTFCLGYSAIATTPDAGTSWFVTRDIGYRRALELYLTNERFDAAKAERLGLVNMVVPAGDLHAHVTKLARRIAEGPLMAITNGKRLFAQAATTPLQQQLTDEIESFANCTRDPDFQEGIGAFLERRRPAFA